MGQTFILAGKDQTKQTSKMTHGRIYSNKITFLAEGELQRQQGDLVWRWTGHAGLLLRGVKLE